jgi:erythromycin esterase-like protein
MWRNDDVVDLVGALRARNEKVAPERRAGFYGLDLYSLYASIEAVLAYLDDLDPAAARRARERYACFGRYRDDGQAYGKATLFGAAPSCEEAALRQVREMHEKARDFAARDGRLDPDDHFHAAQNARVVADAEEYYRAMFRGRVLSWNLRDRHMLETLVSLADHLETTGPGPVKVVVWAHNSHLGDARATELSDSGEFNLGQLCRERFGKDAFLLGFSTHRGTVTAAHDWDGPAQLRRLLPATEGCYESLFHATGIPRFLLFPRRGKHLVVPPEPLLERAVGVVYRPDTERASHYFEAHLSRQFDAVVHLDETRAVEPLDHREHWATEAALAPERV